MEKMKAGFTGFVPKGADYFATLQTYAQIGYRACESGWGLLRSGIDPQEGMARIKEMGLRFFDGQYFSARRPVSRYWRIG